MFGKNKQSKNLSQAQEVKPAESKVASYINNLAHFGETTPTPPSEHVTMKREDGKTASVHKSMIDEYRKGGYELVE